MATDSILMSHTEASTTQRDPFGVTRTHKILLQKDHFGIKGKVRIIIGLLTFILLLKVK